MGLDKLIFTGLSGIYTKTDYPRSHDTVTETAYAGHHQKSTAKTA
jgi:hypothetical protein